MRHFTCLSRFQTAIFIIFLLVVKDAHAKEKRNEKVSELNPTVRQFFLAQEIFEADSLTSVLDQKFEICLENPESEEDQSNGPPKLSLRETQLSLANLIKTSLINALGDIPADSFKIEIDKEAPHLAFQKAEAVFKDAVASAAKSSKIKLHYLLGDVLKAHKTAEVYQWNDFSLQTIFKETAKIVQKNASRLLQTMSEALKLQQYQEDHKGFKKLTTGFKELFKSKPTLHSIEEENRIQSEKDFQYVCKILQTQLAEIVPCIHHFDELFVLLNNYYTEVKKAVQVSIANFQATTSKETHLIFQRFASELQWMQVVSHRVKIGMSINEQNVNSINWSKHIGNAFYDALKINFNTFAQSFEELKKIEIFKSYWKLVELVSRGSPEAALKIMKHFWLAAGLKFSGSENRENVKTARELAKFLLDAKGFSYPEISCLLSAICLWLPDGQELEVGTDFLPSVLRLFPSEVTLHHLPLHLISGNSKFFYSRLILSKEGISLPDLIAELDSRLLLDFDQPFHHVDGFGSKFDKDLDNTIVEPRKGTDLYAYYLIFKIVNLWATNNKKELPSITLFQPGTEWYVDDWANIFTASDPNSKLKQLFITLIKNAGKWTEDETKTFAEQLKSTSDLKIDWESAREVQAQIAALLDSKTRLILL